ncbi:hypothetical protein HUE57_13425 [Candidatus Reidiella endopervernicosa]|uniref:Uncharacterized protein n=1 Tax=Candidatus Reidiella endopervernicosa TaxID=2738883 RepID=A0A6N0I1C3_9GAMM|nr:hypothetical protein HUE57_13425 [Candidatus Reidiella endopervernicosa]
MCGGCRLAISIPSGANFWRV